MTTCKCGKKMSRYATRCKECDRIYYEKLHAEARAIIDSGKCPRCGAGFRRNNSMRGWWQCEQFGTEQFRKDPAKPSCNFQTFTE